MRVRPTSFIIFRLGGRNRAAIFGVLMMTSLTDICLLDTAQAGPPRPSRPGCGVHGEDQQPRLR
jgi:hypothetical protein